MKTLICTDYPTRYAAQFGVWTEAANPQSQGGYEWAVYKEQLPSLWESGLASGIYVTVMSYQNKGLVVEYVVMLPGCSHRQLPVPERLKRLYGYSEYPQLKCIIQAEIAGARSLIRGELKRLLEAAARCLAEYEAAQHDSVQHPEQAL